MKTLQMIYITTASLFFFCATPIRNTYVLSSNYSITIEGTSNVHDWSEKVGVVYGQAIVNMNDDGTYDLEGLMIKLDVNSIKSYMGSIMNSNTYKALKGDENPQIIFTLTSPINSIHADPKRKLISAKGNLNIAGVTRAVEMQANIFIPEKGKLVFEGAESIKMTDYKIQPPTALLGTLKTGNTITINFKTSFTIQ
jgi:hypothetical protein